MTGAGSRALSLLACGVAGWLLLAGAFGMVRSRDVVHTVVCLSVAQSGSYVLLVAVGYQRAAGPPLLGSAPRRWSTRSCRR